MIRATVPRLERGGYDLLIVDSLARWMGNDSSNAAMLDALGALRQVTRLGVGVLAPHHCAKDASAALRAPGRERHPGRAGPVLVAWPACRACTATRCTTPGGCWSASSPASPS